MFGYGDHAIIERNGVVGIICFRVGYQFSVMFEAPNNGVEFKWYPLSAISKFKVIG